VSVLSPDPNRRDYAIGWFPFAGMTEESCVAMHDARFDGVEWNVLTAGPEASASEDFLSLVARGPGANFTHIGRRTEGATGCGAPFTLPNTKLVLALSQARQVDGEGEFLIQGVGLTPAIEVDSEDRSDFEHRLVDRAYGGIDVTGAEYMPRGIRAALSSFE